MEFTLLEKYTDALPGDRLRASLSFMGCGIYSQSGTYHPMDPGIDYDLFLCDPVARKCIASSQRVTDTNEGFDIAIVEEHEVLELWVSRPHGVETLCNHPDDAWAANEPFAFASDYFRIR